LCKFYNSGGSKARPGGHDPLTDYCLLNAHPISAFSVGIMLCFHWVSSSLCSPMYA